MVNVKSNRINWLILFTSICMFIIFSSSLSGAFPIPDNSIDWSSDRFVKLKTGGVEWQSGDGDAAWIMLKDTYTGLSWEVKKNKDDTINGDNLNDADNIYSWDEAQGEDFIGGLNANNFGGSNDWRVPSFEELLTIVSFKNNPAVLNSDFGGLITSEKYYWTSDAEYASSARAIRVTFSNATNSKFTKTHKNYVIAVRGYGLEGRMIDNNDGTITDTRTGMMWKQELQEASLSTWDNRNTYPGTLTDYDDWRVPNVNELSTIVKWSVNAEFFDNFFVFECKDIYDDCSGPGDEAPAGNLWTATEFTAEQDKGKAWYYDMLNLSLSQYDKEDTQYILPVRGGQIKGTGVYITEPRQGDTFKKDDTMNIEWDQGNSSGTVSISISVDAGKTWIPIASGISNNGSANWTVNSEDINQTSYNCSLKITPSSGAGSEIGFFTLCMPPSVSISTPVPVSTEIGPVVYTITYAGADNITLIKDDITVDKTGDVTVGTWILYGSGTTTRSVQLSNITGSGTLNLSIKENTATSTICGYNTMPGAELDENLACGIGKSCRASISDPDIDTTKDGPVIFTIAYSNAANIFLSNDTIDDYITINKTNDVSVGTITVAGTGTEERTVTLSDIDGNGTLGIFLKAASAEDVDGEKADAAGPSATCEIVCPIPTLTISNPSSSTIENFNDSTEVFYTITYDLNGGTSLLDNSYITLIKTSSANAIVSVNGNKVTLSSLSGNGTLKIEVKKGSATNDCGEAEAAGPSEACTLVCPRPKVVISREFTNECFIPSGGVVEFDVEYNDDTDIDKIKLDTSNVNVQTRSGNASADVNISGGGRDWEVKLTAKGDSGSFRFKISYGSGESSCGRKTSSAYSDICTLFPMPAIKTGDFNTNNEYDLGDVIIALKVSADFYTNHLIEDYVEMIIPGGADLGIRGDCISVADALYLLKEISKP